jgi:CheY-like chemotaxis protein
MPDQMLVLVAEDEELVRLIIVDALEDAGLEVIAPVNGATPLAV